MRRIFVKWLQLNWILLVMTAAIWRFYDVVKVDLAISFPYSSNIIRKIPNVHLNIGCQNLIICSCEFKYIFWGCLLGLTLWNLSCLEFKFDDTRLSYWHKNKIGRIEIFFCCFLTLLIFCCVGLLSFDETANRAEN